MSYTKFSFPAGAITLWRAPTASPHSSSRLKNIYIGSDPPESGCKNGYIFPLINLDKLAALQCTKERFFKKKIKQ